MQYELDPANLRMLLALARGGTLAAAAERLGQDSSTVFRALGRVEKGLGQTLFERSRSGYRATELGLQLAQHAERIEAELEAARSAAQGVSGTVAGTVRVSTTDTLLHGLLLPTLAPLAQAHPQLQFELNAGNELANLSQREADIALRATRRPPPHLVGRHLGPIRAAVFAPRGLKRGRGAAAAWEQLPWIAPDDALPGHPSVMWRRKHRPKAVLQVQVNSVQSVLEAIGAGLGVGIAPLFLAAGRRDVQQVTDALEECETPLWLLAHPESRNLRRIATVFAHLAEHLRLP